MLTLIEAAHQHPPTTQGEHGRANTLRKRGKDADATGLYDNKKNSRRPPAERSSDTKPACFGACYFCNRAAHVPDTQGCQKVEEGTYEHNLLTAEQLTDLKDFDAFTVSLELARSQREREREREARRRATGRNVESSDIRASTSLLIGIPRFW